MTRPGCYNNMNGKEGLSVYLLKVARYSLSWTENEREEGEYG